VLARSPREAARDRWKKRPSQCERDFWWHFVRHHNIRYGVEYENIDYANTVNRTGPTFTLPDGTQTVTGAQIEIDPSSGRSSCCLAC
jgi:hypothetical protein